MAVPSRPSWLPPADWLTIDRVADGSIVLTAKESPEKYRRRVKVLLTVGTTLTEIELSRKALYSTSCLS